ncbi:hypothetical protein HK101_004571 [Irineochytrium annulatum]|nr:hypothetical protein HK101_004571 [Irineochytrium annulatum]
MADSPDYVVTHVPPPLTLQTSVGNMEPVPEVREFTSGRATPKRHLVPRTGEVISRNKLVVEGETLRATVAGLTSQVEVCKVENEGLRGELKEKEGQLGQLKTEVEGLREKVGSLEPECEALRSAKTANETTIAEQVARVAELEGAVEEAGRVNEELRGENTRLNEDCRMYVGKIGGLEDMVAKQKERIYENELTIENLQRKVQILADNNEMKQRIIVEFERKITAESFGFDAKHVAVLREFQAHRLQELYQKSRKHLELERRQNATLRTTISESQNASVIEALRLELAKARDDFKDSRRENQALKVIQHQHEREIVHLTESNARGQADNYAEEVTRLKIQIQRMEEERMLQHGHHGGGGAVRF